MLELDILDLEPPQAGGKPAKQILTKPLAVYSDGKVETLDYERSFSTAPGTKARTKMVTALESENTEDSDVYVTLHALARPLHASRVGDKLSSAPKQVELATAWINLEEMLHQAKRDTRNEELTLRVADGARKDSVMARVRIDVEALAAMKRVQESLRATSLKVEVHKVQLTKELVGKVKGDALRVGGRGAAARVGGAERLWRHGEAARRLADAGGLEGSGGGRVVAAGLGSLGNCARQASQAASSIPLGSNLKTYTRFARRVQ